MNIFTDKYKNEPDEEKTNAEKPDENAPLSDKEFLDKKKEEATARQVIYEELYTCFSAAVKSDRLEHYNLIFTRIAIDEFTIHKRNENQRRVTVINDTITFNWKNALPIFMQDATARRLIKQRSDVDRVFGVSRSFIGETFELHENREKERATKEETEDENGGIRLDETTPSHEAEEKRQ